MDTLILPAEDWYSIAHLAQGRKVLMVGYCDGRDVVSVAMESRITVVVGDSEDDPSEACAMHRLAAHQYLRMAGALDRAIIHQGDYLDALAGFHGPQFDLAVVNPWALGWGLLDGYMRLVARAATDVVLIERERCDSWDAMIRLFPREEYSNTKSGRLIVAKCREVAAPLPVEV